MPLTLYLWKEGNNFIDNEGYLTNDPRCAKVLGSWQQAYNFKARTQTLACRWELFKLTGTLEKDGE